MARQFTLKIDYIKLNINNIVELFLIDNTID